MGRCRDNNCWRTGKEAGGGRAVIWTLTASRQEVAKRWGWAGWRVMRVASGGGNTGHVRKRPGGSSQTNHCSGLDAHSFSSLIYHRSTHSSFCMTANRNAWHLRGLQLGPRENPAPASPAPKINVILHITCTKSISPGCCQQLSEDWARCIARNSLDGKKILGMFSGDAQGRA